MDPLSDAQLVAAAQAGDPAALDQLLARHLPRVVRFASHLCDNPADAEEAAQDALLSVVRGLGAWRGEGAFTTWLYGVTRGACSHKRRRRKGAPVATDVLDGELEGATGDEGPEDVASSRELGGAVALAIRGLDPAQREVLVLRDVEGLSAPEVADALGLTIATVKTRLHRARAAVRAAVAPRMTPSALPSASCPEVVARFSRYLEGEIGPAECEQMHAHVDGCPACNAACASLRRTVAVCRDAAGPPPPEVVSRVRAALSVVVGRRLLAPG